ncbi:hypothetical protein KAT24_02385 [Candidatus Pacearchaeota archaeon]|nr:hypothetical protein [Candidatus Pacearchaeota archaeon]
MRRIIISLLLVILLLSPISAEIIINEQPNDVYNLGDTISVPATIKAVGDISGIFQMDLLCEGHQINFYRNGVSLLTGEEKNFDASIVLVKEMISELKGDCKIKAMLGEDYLLTKDFKISDFLTMQIEIEEKEFNPGEEIIIKGSAVKENGKDVNGFIDAEIIITGDNSSDSMFQPGTINNGFFSLEIPTPTDMKAGAYLIKLNAYEKDTQEEITNKGFLDYNIVINQVPTNLELIIENQEIEPGTNLVLKTILHDQTGESIESTSSIILKNNQNLVMEQTEIATGETFEYSIKHNEAPTEWKVVAESNTLITELSFTIMEKADVNVEIINKTMIITNIGNVFYNKTVLVKIANESLNIYVNLGIDESQKYVLNAPDGEYPVDVISQEGNKLSEKVILTGKAIGIREAQGEFLRAVKSPFVWIFIIIILGVVAFMIFRKVRKKPFSGHIINFKKKDKIKKLRGKKSLIDTSNRAELSLSIQGDKQDASIICLKIKNLEEITSKKGNCKETIQNLIEAAEKHKVAIYENQENIFFILAPIKTRTYKNEKASVKIAHAIKEILSEHNKTSKQKIDFGISLNYGAIIAKQEDSTLKFMSIGTLITTAKKIASIAKREFLLSEKINDRLRSYVKTEKHTINKVPFYIITKIKKDDDESKKFIRSFLKRIEKKK